MATRLIADLSVKNGAYACLNRLLIVLLSIPGLSQLAPVARAAQVGSGNQMVYVTITPQGAIDAGAKWKVGNSAWLNSQDQFYTNSTGSMTITFKAISGWIAPADISFTMGVGGTKLFTDQNYTLNTAPVVASFSPNSGVAGNTVTINGGNLANASVKFYDNKAATIQSNTSTKIVVTVPAGAATGQFHVTTSSGTVPSGSNFTIASSSYTLTTSVGQTGWGTVSPSGTNSYSNGAGLNIYPNPATGYQFSHWSGDASGSSNPLSVVMSTNKNIVANFSVAPVPTGTIKVTANGVAANEINAVILYNANKSTELDRKTNPGANPVSFTGKTYASHQVDVYCWDMLVGATANSFNHQSATTSVSINTNTKLPLKVGVTYSGGTIPYPAATVLLDSWNGQTSVWTNRASGTTDSNGYVTINAFPTGAGEKYRLRVNNSNGTEIGRQDTVSVSGSLPAASIITTQTVPTGTINVTVRNAAGSQSGTAVVSDAVAKLFNGSYAPLNQDRATNASGLASWISLTPGAYYVEAWSPNGLEYWGGANPTVTGNQATNATITRNEPYATSFRVLSGATDITGGSVAAGTPLTYEVTVRNDTSINRPVRVTLRTGRTNSSPYDFGPPVSAVQTVNGNGGTKTFTFPHTPNVAGSYSRSFEVETDTDDSSAERWNRTDGWAWVSMLTVTAQESPLVFAYPVSTLRFTKGAAFTIPIVVKQANGTPAANVDVGLEDGVLLVSRMLGKTDAEGRVTIAYTANQSNALQAGAYQITAIANGYKGTLLFSILDPAMTYADWSSSKAAFGAFSPTNLQNNVVAAVARNPGDFSVPMPNHVEMLEAGEEIGEFLTEWGQSAGNEFLDDPVNQVAIVGAVVSCTLSFTPAAPVAGPVCAGSLGFLKASAIKATVSGGAKTVVDKLPIAAQTKQELDLIIDGAGAIYSVATLKPGEGVKAVWEAVDAGWEVGNFSLEWIYWASGQVRGFRLVAVKSDTGETRVIHVNSTENPDPYGIAAYEPEGWDLYSQIPLENRHGLVDLAALADDQLRDNNGATLGASDGKLVIIFHGWNDSAQRFKPLTDALFDHQRLPSEWKAIRYNWSNDAATGNTFPYYTLAQKAAERAYQHGLLVGGKLLEQVGAANLKAVHFIGHSAGAWAALAAARCVNLNTSTTEVQVTFLDPYIPNNETTFIPHSHPFHRSYLESAPINCARVNTAGPFKAEAYWSDDPITWPTESYPGDSAIYGTGNYTQVTWSWSSESRSVVKQTDGDTHGDANWDGHDGPIHYFRDSIVEPLDPSLGSGGWKNSLAYRDAQVVPTYFLSGRVTSREFPSHGIGEVAVTLNNGATTTTTYDGAFSFSGLNAGSYTVTASHPDFFATGSATTDSRSVTITNSSVSAIDFSQFLGKATPQVDLQVSNNSPKPGDSFTVTAIVRNTGPAVANVEIYLDLSFDVSAVEVGTPSGSGWTTGPKRYPNTEEPTIYNINGQQFAPTDALVSAQRTGSFATNGQYSFTVPITVMGTTAPTTPITFKYRATIAARRDPISSGSGTRDQQGYNVKQWTVLVAEPGGGATPPVFNQQPLSQSVFAAGNAGFTVAVSGSPMPSLQWQVSTNGGGSWADVTNGGVYSGATTATLTITGATAGMNGYRYRALASNSVQGNVASNNAELTVQAAATSVIGLSGNLNFGNVTVGSTATATLTIANSGNSALTVSGISYPTGFSGSTTASVSAGGSVDLTVTFAPTAAQSYSGDITVTSDATSGTNTIAVSGTGVVVGLPTVTTGSVANLTSTGATVASEVTADGGATVTSRGHALGTSPGPTTASPLTVTTGTGLGAFTSSLVLTPGTIYYVRAFATNSAGTAYGEEREFTTPAAASVVTTLAGQAGTPGFANGLGAEAQFYYPQGVVVAANGDLYVADEHNNRIRRITTEGMVETYAGGGAGSTDGPIATATFNRPNSIARDVAGNLYVTEFGNKKLRKITVGGEVSTLASFSGYPGAVTVDPEGNAYVAETGSHVIRKISASGVNELFAGTSGVAGATNGDRLSASFRSPVGLALDVTGNLYVADQWNHVVRRITPEGLVSTLAGLAGMLGYADGAAVDACFRNPVGLTLDGADNLLVTEGNHTIRRIALADGQVSTLAGQAGVAGAVDGALLDAQFNGPGGMAFASNGDLYVADASNHLIRKIAGVGPASTVLDPVVSSMPATGGAYSISVSANGTWTAASDQVWATVSPASGSGNGAVTVTVAANATTTGRTATLTIGGQTHTLTQTGVAVTKIIGLSFTPGANFGNVTAGQAASRTLTITNSGNSALTVSGVSYPDGFSGNWSAGTIPAGGSQNVTVTFAPTAMQVYSGTITANSDAISGTNTIGPSGLGVPLMTGSLTFGSVVVGQTASRTFTITNTDSISRSFGIIYPEGFSGDWPSGSIPAGGNQTVSVTFSPTAVQTYGGVVTMSLLPAFDFNGPAISGIGTLDSPIPGSLASWRSSKFAIDELENPAISGPTADPDNDGLTNLIEYALGLEPKAGDATGRPEMSTNATDWIYTYTQPVDRSDVTYAVEFSTDLVNWSPTGVTHELVSSTGGTETWRGRYALANANNAFFRLKVALTSGETGYASPHGGMTFTVPANQTRSFALPVWHERAGAGRQIGRIGAVGTNYADVTNAGWAAGGLSNPANPYYLRVLTGNSAGRALPVSTTANTDSRVFLTNDGVGLDLGGITVGAGGDGYELVLADTLASLFGSTTLLGGTDATVADNVQTWTGASWLVFYYNTVRNRWERNTDTAASPSRDNFVLRPDRGIMIARRAATDLKFHLTGRVPTIAARHYHARPGTSFLSNGLPKDITLAALGLETRVSGWIAGTSPTTAAGSADLLQVWSGASWLTFYYDSTNGRWQREGEAAQTNRDTFVIPAGRPIMIRRVGGAGPATESLIPFPLNYTITR